VVLLTELSIAVVVGLAFVVGLVVFVVGVAIIQRQVSSCVCVCAYVCVCVCVCPKFGVGVLQHPAET